MAEKSFMTVEEVATELRVSKSKAYQVVRELMVLCQDLVQVKIRNFSLF